MKLGERKRVMVDDLTVLFAHRCPSARVGVHPCLIGMVKTDHQASCTALALDDASGQSAKCILLWHDYICGVVFALCVRRTALTILNHENTARYCKYDTHGK